MKTAGPANFDAVATLATVGALLSWSTAPIFIRYLGGHFDSWSQNLFRYLAAVSGVLCIALGHAIYYTAIKRIGATIPTMVLLCSPFLVMAMSRLIFKETLNSHQLFFGIILIIGAIVAIWAQQHLKQP